MLARGERNSCDTVETKSDFICATASSARTVRSVMYPPKPSSATSTTSMASDSCCRRLTATERAAGSVRRPCHVLTGLRRERCPHVVAFNGGEQIVTHVWRPEDDGGERLLTPERERC